MKTRLSRRQALGALGTISLGGLLAACGDGDDGAAGRTVQTTQGTTATVEPKTTTAGAAGALFDDAASCAVTPEETAGPYYFDADRIRSDIREDREGARLRLALRVRDAASCSPIADAVVDIWHADAGGAYSGFDGARGGARRGAGGMAQSETRYLRGAQVTNADGIVEFTTIYPGWYPGRTVHIHARSTSTRRPSSRPSCTSTTRCQTGSTRGARTPSAAPVTRATTPTGSSTRPS